MANFSLTRHARHRTMGLRQLAGRSTKEGRGKRAVWSWIGRHSYHSAGQNVKNKKLDRTSDSLRKKWTFGLPRQRAASRRHVFEAYINWFALILQVHRTQSFNNLGEEVAIRYR